MTPGPDSVSVKGEGLRRELLRARERVLAEIRATPPAIPACDAQFNHLLERRAALGRDLGRLDDILAANVSSEEKARRLADFRRDSALPQPDPYSA